MQDPRDISINQYDYRLPEERIARYPLAERDQSKLLVWENGKISDSDFTKLIYFLPNNSLLVFNQSSVINARLLFTNDKGVTIEIFCLESEEEISKALASHGTVLWRCLVGGLKKWKQHSLELKTGTISLSAQIVERRSEDALVRFSWEPNGLTFSEVLGIAGELPVPPYLNRKSEEIDRTRYQTVYAENKGSVAAPTAGLHFTPAMLASLQREGVRNLKLTLHVGSGTFKPVKASSLGGHSMHAEWISISNESLESLLNWAQNKKPVIAVGTTSLRAMESVYWLGVKLLQSPDNIELEVGQWDPYTQMTNNVSTVASLSAVNDYMKAKNINTLHCRTSLLIAPPYRLKVASGLVTNFHQPRSTLLLLVCAFAGERWRDIYEHALVNNYRFLSYGDSSLLLT